mgnify:FL=1
MGNASGTMRALIDAASGSTARGPRRMSEMWTDELGLCYCAEHRRMRCGRCCCDYIEPNEMMLEEKLEEDGCDAATKRRMMADPFQLKVYMMWCFEGDPTMEGKIDAFVRELDDDGLFESDDVAEEDVDDFCALHGAEPK